MFKLMCTIKCILNKATRCTPAFKRTK